MTVVAEIDVREGHVGIGVIVVLPCFVILRDLFVGHVDRRGDETVGDELQRLDETLLDDVVVLVHAQRQRFPVQRLFADVVIDEPFEFRIAKRVETRGRRLGVESFRTELDEREQCRAIDHDRPAVEVTVLRGDQVEEHEQADADREEMQQGFAQQTSQKASPTPK